MTCGTRPPSTNAGSALAERLCELWPGPQASIWASHGGTEPGTHASFGTASAIDPSEANGSVGEASNPATGSFAAIDAAVRFTRYALHGQNPAIRGTDRRPAAASRGDHIAVRETMIAELGGNVTREALLAAAGCHDYEHLSCHRQIRSGHGHGITQAPRGPSSTRDQRAMAIRAVPRRHHRRMDRRDR